MSNRQKLIELIHDASNDDKFSPKTKNDLKSLLKNLIGRRINDEDAQAKYLDLVNIKSKGYWHEIFKPKAIFNTLKKYYGGELTDVQVMKLISSIYTHMLIESEQNPGIDKGLLKLSELTEMMQSYNSSYSVDKNKVNELLESLGLTL